MKKAFVLIFLAVSVFACTDKKKNLREEIQSIDNNDSLVSNQTMARFNRLLREYVGAYPADENNPAYYFKIAQSANALNEPSVAVRYLDTFMTRHPEHPRVPDALLLKGYTYENIAHDKDKALECYEDFIVKYPGHPSAEQAKLAIVQIDKTPEELVKEFLSRDSTIR